MQINNSHKCMLIKIAMEYILSTCSTTWTHWLGILKVAGWLCLEFTRWGWSTQKLDGQMYVIASSIKVTSDELDVWSLLIYWLVVSRTLEISNFVAFSFTLVSEETCWNRYCLIPGSLQVGYLSDVDSYNSYVTVGDEKSQNIYISYSTTVSC